MILSDGGAELKAIRKGTWKMFIQAPYNTFSPEESNEKLPILFNVDEDPSEKYNVAKDHPDVLEELTALATAHQKSVVEVPSMLEKLIEK